MKKILFPLILLGFSFSIYAKVDQEMIDLFKKIDPNYVAPQERELVETKMITIDTRDRLACKNTVEMLIEKKQIPRKKDLCRIDQDNPYITITLNRKIDAEYNPGFKFHEMDIDPRVKELGRRYKGLAALSALTSAAIFILPEDISKWDRNKILKGNLSEQWESNVKQRPVMDNDPWPVNYIGHPMSGAFYYTTARHSGFNRLESFGISVLLSTVYWEYGVEAVSERPSIQDLIITPIIGSLMGEVFMQIEEMIDNNNGEIFGSKRAGDVAKVLIDPIGATANGIDRLADYVGLEIEEVIGTPVMTVNDNHGNKFYIGVNFQIKF